MMSFRSFFFLFPFYNRWFLYSVITKGLTTSQPGEGKKEKKKKQMYFHIELETNSSAIIFISVRLSMVDIFLDYVTVRP